MKKKSFFLFTVIILLLHVSCSNISAPVDSNSNIENDNFDKDNIKGLNNAIDTLVKSFNKVYARNGATSKKGIVGSFSYTVKYGNGYSSGSYNYSYTYNFYDTGSYTLSYSQNISNGHGSDGYSVTEESGSFVLTKNDNLFYIIIKSSKGTETKYRYLLSESFLVLLNANDKTEYKLDLDKTTYEYNSTDDDLRDVEHYSRNSGYNGILGKWTMYIGELWSETGYDFMGNLYENKYWPKVLEIEFGEDGIFTLTKKVTSRETNKTVTNYVQGVYGVIETGEKKFQIALVSMNEKQLLSHYKVSNYYLHFDKSLEEIFTSFEISYSSIHGVIPSPITVEENLRLTEQQLPTLTCNGYKFLGWYIGDERIVADSFFVTKNINLQAKWQQTGYLVYFETNTSQTVTSQVLSYLYKDEMPIILRDGYTFDGWYLNSICTNAIQYPYKIQQSITIYANWLKNYEVSFETNSEIKLQPLITAKIETMPMISKNGYVFSGWYLNSDYSQIAQFPLEISLNTKLYANWKSDAEALLLTSEIINNVIPQDFLQPMTIFLKGEFTYNDIWNLCYKMKDSSYPVNINLFFTEGITDVEYYKNKNIYVIRSKDWTGTFQEEYLKNVTINWYEIIQK